MVSVMNKLGKEDRAMKRIILMVCAALVALVSCEKQPVENPSNEGSEIVFNLSATHPGDTKAVKTGWEENDVIFVFIQGQTAPAYLEMKWDGSSWVNTSKGLSAIADGSVSMRAVYLPFGSTATVSNLVNNSAFKLSTGEGFSFDGCTLLGWSDKDLYDPADSSAHFFELGGKGLVVLQLFDEFFRGFHGCVLLFCFHRFIRMKRGFR